MFIKTAELKITEKIQDSIRNKWNDGRVEYSDVEVLDAAVLYNFILNVKYELKTGRNTMPIQSSVSLKRELDDYKLVVHCNVLKPIVVSMILGALVAVLFLVIHLSLVFALPVGALIAVGTFAFFYLKIKLTVRDYLAVLKRDGLKLKQ